MSRLMLVAILCLFPSVTLAQSDDKEPGWWNPMRVFGAPEETRSDDFLNDPVLEKDSFFSMSPPAWMKPSSIKKSTQSGMSKFAQTSKKFWAGTVSLLNPFDNKPSTDKVVTASFDSRNGGYKPQLEEPSTGFRWFWQKPEEKKDLTINDWLSRPNPVIHGQKFID